MLQVNNNNMRQSKQIFFNEGPKLVKNESTNELPNFKKRIFIFFLHRDIIFWQKQESTADGSYPPASRPEILPEKYNPTFIQFIYFILYTINSQVRPFFRYCSVEYNR